jgi:hypothetical protein
MSPLHRPLGGSGRRFAQVIRYAHSHFLITARAASNFTRILPALVFASQCPYPGH